MTEQPSEQSTVEVIDQLNRDNIPAEFIRRIGAHDEAWARGNVLFVVPAIPMSAPSHLRRALKARRETSLYGRCPICHYSDAVTDRSTPIPTARTLHETDCPATDKILTRLLHAWKMTGS